MIELIMNDYWNASQGDFMERKYFRWANSMEYPSLWLLMQKKLYQIIIWIMHRIFSTWRNSIIAKITLILFYQPSIDWYNTTTVIITLTVSCQWVLHNSVSHSYNYSASHYITIPPVTLILLCLSLLCYSTNHYITILPVTFILLC